MDSETQGSKLSPDVKPFIPKGTTKGISFHSQDQNNKEENRRDESFRNFSSTFEKHSSESLTKAQSNRLSEPSLQNEGANPRKYENLSTEVKVAKEKKPRSLPAQTSQLKYESRIQWKKSNMRPASANLGSRRWKNTMENVPRQKDQPKHADTFEVSLKDFPELNTTDSQSPFNSLRQNPKQAWVTASLVTSTDEYCVTEPSSLVSSTGNVESEKKPNSFVPTCEPECGSLINKSTPEVQVSQKTFPDSVSVLSWASIASLPPKVMVKKESTAAISEKSQKQNIGTEGDIVNISKKKNRKKKKKTRESDISEACEENRVLVLDPPKFEDEEEFPDLSAAAAGNESKASKHHFSYSNMAKGQKESSVNKDSGSEAAALILNRPLQGKDQQKSKTTSNQNMFNVKEPIKAQKAEKTSGKKSKVPVQLDLGNVLAVLEQKQQAQKSKLDAKSVVLSVGGALPVMPKGPSIPKKHPRQVEQLPHNPLDSTSPLVKKGKQREVPKPKKSTPMKRIILKEREERKQRRLYEEQGIFFPAEDENDVSKDVCFDLPHEEETTETCLTEQCETKESSAPDSLTAASHPKIHSRRFREYCSQVLNKDVDECVISLLKELVRFQDRLYQKDPMKAKIKRRLVMGLREVLKHLKLKKVKCVIISPNCEKIQSKGGLDEALQTIISTCMEQSVPFVFALNRKALGHCVNKAVPVSVVGIFNYDGAQDYFHKMIDLSTKARQDYEEMISSLEKCEDEGLEGEENDQNQSVVEERSPAPLSDLDEPEYIKLWRRMLENDNNYETFNFEEYLASRTLNLNLTQSEDIVDS
ncbi:selenocysteine insertion sequence-binding protein 2-like isoform X8 [Erpetoichthys calabaricus]|uniref:selenocysteine insertion sequence-binding protein 2-like isoform X1 n=1 Tax=Erpetoichthys calabaricus TaxID=27687 RepID=UPI002234553C|nr:selenocysteine insertion sequence-binding protein 2-like isoform X1 [Erpetoichthys calabaricus]XP_051785676.1 selenocysteine insertion sequence-binding protein 2-like isoform X8 [Erpetoichthys calabaricus]